MPAGWSEWYVGTPHDQSVYDYTLNENGTLVEYGRNRANFKQDVLTRKAVLQVIIGSVVCAAGGGGAAHVAGAQRRSRERIAPAVARRAQGSECAHRYR